MIHDQQVQVIECRWFERVGRNEISNLIVYRESTRVEWQTKRFQYLQSMCAENYIMAPNDGPDLDKEEIRPPYVFLEIP
jgi:hypothetical protein